MCLEKLGCVILSSMNDYEWGDVTVAELDCGLPGS